jgi:hypothetical protein
MKNEIITFHLDSKDTKPIDPLLLVSIKEIFPWVSSSKVTFLLLDCVN